MRAYLSILFCVHLAGCISNIEKGDNYSKAINNSDNKSVVQQYSHLPFFNDVLEGLKEAQRINYEETAPYFYKDNVYKYIKVVNQQGKVLFKSSLESYKRGDPDWIKVLELDDFRKRFGAEMLVPSMRVPFENSRYAYFQLSKGGSDNRYYVEYDFETDTFHENGFKKFGDNLSNFVVADTDTVYFIDSLESPEERTYDRFGTNLYRWNRKTNTNELVFKMPQGSQYPYLYRYEANGKSHAVLFYWLNNQYYQFNTEIQKVSEFQATWSYYGYKNRLYFSLNPSDIYGTTTNAGENVYSILPKDIAASKKLNEASSLLTYKNPNPKYRVRAFHPFGDKVAVIYKEDAKQHLYIYDLNKAELIGKALDTNSYDALSLFRRPDSPDSLFIKKRSFSSFIELFRFDAKKPFEPVTLTVNADIQKKDVVSKKFQAPSADGVSVDYVVIAKKSVIDNPNAPTIVKSYGGYGIINHIYVDGFSSQWINNGGKFVWTAIRGGGEKGSNWAKEGRHKKKINSIIDVNSAINHMYQEGISKPSNTALFGFSNGGLVNLSAMTLFNPDVAAIAVGGPLVDMENYTKWGSGKELTAEYGDPSIPVELEFIKKYSPLSTFDPNADYPPVGIFYSEYDDRVPPQHPLSMYRKLKSSNQEVYLYNSGVGGHVYAEDTEEQVLNDALMLSFLWDKTSNKE